MTGGCASRPPLRFETEGLIVIDSTVAVGFHPIGPAPPFGYIFTSMTPVILISQRKNEIMKSSTHDKTEGTAKTIAGTIKESTGKVLGNPRLRTAGTAEKIEGQSQKKVGEIKQVLGN